MPEPRIARTVAEARVGDLLWCEPDQWRRHPDKIYLVVVTKVARIYLHADRLDCHGLGKDYSRDTGGERMPSGWSPTAFVQGAVERERVFWLGRSNKMAKAIDQCRDLDTLRTVAFALGMDGPPDFSIVPQPETQSRRMRPGEGGVGDGQPQQQSEQE